MYHVSNSDFEGGLAYLANRDGHRHVLDGVLNVPVESYKLGDIPPAVLPYVLESYLENHFCDEAHLYINLPNRKEFEAVENAITTAETNAGQAAETAATNNGKVLSKEDKAKIEKDARETETPKQVQKYFHDKSIYQKALPGVLRNKHIKKLIVHRVVGFTHASFGDMVKKHAKPIAQTTLHADDLTQIFDKAHIMDPVEFDMEEYRKDSKIQICQTDPNHAACSDVANKDWHAVEFITPTAGFPSLSLPYRTKGLTRFVDDMYLSLAAEYQNVLQDPSGAKGESFRDIWKESQKVTHAVYVERVKTATPSNMDYDLTHVATREEWPSIFTSVATTIQKGMRTEGSAGLYEKYVVGGDISRLLPLLALGIPFLMYR
jgi:hypothetical protein